MHRLVTANARAPRWKLELLAKTCVQAVTIASIEGHPLNSCIIERIVNKWRLMRFALQLSGKSCAGR